MAPKLMIVRALGALFPWRVRIELIYEPMVAQNSHFPFQFGSICLNSSMRLDRSIFSEVVVL